MADRPTEYPDWATEDDSGRSEPPEAMKESGFQPYDFVPRQWQNWMWWKVGEWIRWFDDVIEDIAIALPWARGYEAFDITETEKVLSPANGVGYGDENDVGGSWSTNGLVVGPRSGQPNKTRASLRAYRAGAEASVVLTMNGNELGLETWNQDNSIDTELMVREVSTSEARDRATDGTVGFTTPRRVQDGVAEWAKSQSTAFISPSGLAGGTGTLLSNANARVIGDVAELWFRLESTSSIELLSFEFDSSAVFASSVFSSHATSRATSDTGYVKRLYKSPSGQNTWRVDLSAASSSHVVDVYMVGRASLVARQRANWA